MKNSQSVWSLSNQSNIVTKYCLASSVPEQRSTRANKHVCAHTFERTHLSPECAAQTEHTHRLLLFTGVILGFAICLMALKLYRHKEPSHWASKQSPAFEQRGPFIGDNDTDTHAHMRARAPAHAFQYVLFAPLRQNGHIPFWAEWWNLANAKFQPHIMQSHQTCWFHNVVMYNRKQDQAWVSH